ncbi:MAG: adenylate/guanylate cyclase domain-containing protein [Bacteroidota bacterium]
MNKEQIILKALALIAISCLLFNKSFSQSPYIIYDTLPVQALDGYLLTWEDSSKTATASEILADTIGTKFTFQTYNPDQPKIDLHAYWAKLRIESKVDIENWQLTFQGKNWRGNGFLRGNGIVEVFTYKEGKIVHTEKTGAKIPANEKAIRENYNVSKVPFSIRKGESKDLLIRIESRYEGFNLPPDFGLTLIAPPKERRVEGLFGTQSEDNYRLFFSLYLGVALMAFFYHLLLFFYLRESIYGWFSLWMFVVTITIFNFHPQSFLVDFLLPDAPILAGKILSIPDAFIWVSFWQFGRVFIDTRRNFPRLDKALWVLIGLLGIDAILAFFAYDSRPIMDVHELFQLIGNLSGFVFACILLFKKDLKARYFGFGAFVATFSVIIGVLWFIGIISLPFDPFLTASFLQIFIYSFGLAYWRQLKAKDKEAAERQLLINEQEKAEQLEKINTASAKFVPSTFLNFLGKENILDARLGEYVEKPVSVLFLDIRDYTSLSEKMTPKENFRFVQSFHKRMGPVISRYEGFVNQYLGDGIMAIFPEHAEGTLQAAIEMRRILDEYNEERISKEKTPIRIGIGIHRGPLIMGIIGDNERMDAATISDTVNAAARVEGLTKHFGTSILLSEACVSKLEYPEGFGLRYLGEVQVKGKQKAMKIYECFDADEANVRRLKRESLEDFGKGIQLYVERNFAEASQLFQAISEKNPQDLVAKKFLDKVNTLLEDGVSEDWTAVEMMQTK